MYFGDISTHTHRWTDMHTAAYIIYAKKWNQTSVHQFPASGCMWGWQSLSLYHRQAARQRRNRNNIKYSMPIKTAFGVMYWTGDFCFFTFQLNANDSGHVPCWRHSYLSVLHIVTFDLSLHYRNNVTYRYLSDIKLHPQREDAFVYVHNQIWTMS